MDLLRFRGQQPMRWRASSRRTRPSITHIPSGH